MKTLLEIKDFWENLDNPFKKRVCMSSYEGKDWSLQIHNGVMKVFNASAWVSEGVYNMIISEIMELVSFNQYNMMITSDGTNELDTLFK